MKLPDYRQKKSGIGVRSRPKGVEIPPKITKMCVQLNGTNRSTQANEAGSGGFRRRRHRRLHRGMCKGAPRPDAAGPSAVRDCPTARSRHDSLVAAAACEGMEDRREDQPVRTSGAPERACPPFTFHGSYGSVRPDAPFSFGPRKMVRTVQDSRPGVSLSGPLPLGGRTKKNSQKPTTEIRRA